jgi:hypothetical protein
MERAVVRGDYRISGGAVIVERHHATIVDFQVS